MNDIIELLHGTEVILRSEIESVQSVQGECDHTVKGWMGGGQISKGVLHSWCGYIFVDHLLYAKHCSRFGGYICEPLPFWSLYFSY